MTTLALADSWMIGLAIGQMIFNAIVGLALIWIKQRQRQFDDLQSEVKSYATELINTKFASLAEQAQAIINRLERGDAKFDQQDERDRKLELKFVQRVEELHRTVLETFTTKKEHHHLAGKVETLQSQVDRQKGAA